MMLVGIRALVPDIEGDIVSPPLPTRAFTPLRFTDYMTALKAERKCTASISLSDFLMSLPFEIDLGVEIPANATLEDLPELIASQTNEPLSDEELDIFNLFISNPSLFGLELPGTFGITGFYGQLWHVPLLKCDPVHCTAPNQNASDFCEVHIVGVAGSAASSFISWVTEEYPGSDNVFVQFEDSQDIDQYVESKDYGRNKAKLAMGIVFDDETGGDIWSYHLRPNSTNINFPATEEGRRGARTTPDTGLLQEQYARVDDVCDLEGADGTLDANSCTYQYALNGVLTFQRLVHDFIGNQTGTSSSYPVGATDFATFPSRDYETNGFFSAISSMLFTFIGFIAFILTSFLLQLS